MGVRRSTPFRLVLLFGLMCLMGPTVARAEDRPPDAPALAEPSEPPGRIDFKAKTPLFDADGTFERWAFSEIHIDPNDPQASFVVVEVDVASVDTGIGRRDAHLRRDDFFDVEQFPKATVRVQGVRPAAAEGDAQRYAADFVLTIRGIEKAVEGTFEIVTLSPPTVRGELVVDRVDFEVGKPKSRWNPMSIDNEIPIRFRAVVPVDPETGKSLL